MTGVPSTPAPQRGITGWIGVVWFAATMTIMLGGFNIIDGLAAVLENEIFVTTAAGVVLFDVTTWGWVHFIIGAMMVIAGIFLFTGATWARIVVVALAVLNSLAQMMFLAAYPVWSVIIIAVDVIVIWALIVHGGEARELDE